MSTYKQTTYQIVAKVAGLEVEEISDELFLDADLNLTEGEISTIIKKIEEKLELDIKDESEFIETVGDLAEIVGEEVV